MEKWEVESVHVEQVSHAHRARDCQDPLCLNHRGEIHVVKGCSNSPEPLAPSPAAPLFDTFTKDTPVELKITHDALQLCFFFPFFSFFFFYQCNLYLEKNINKSSWSHICAKNNVNIKRGKMRVIKKKES